MNRIQSIDVFKGLAITGVVLAHTAPFSLRFADESTQFWWLCVALNQIVRFIIPLFLSVSGYFWAKRIEREGNLVSPSLAMAKRIALVFVVWCIVYLMPYNLVAFFEYGALGPIRVAYWHLNDLMRHPFRILLQGTEVHLWFLPALVIAMAITALFVARGRIVSLFLLAAILYVVGVLAGAYAKTPIGIATDFDTRNGPFFVTIFFAFGYLMSKFETNRKWALYGLLLFCAGCAMHFCEVYVLWKVFKTHPQQDYVIGTAVMGIGTALMALSNHPILRNETLAKLGRMSLGIYVVHGIFVINLQPLGQWNSPLWGLTRVAPALVLSVLTTKLLYRNTITRRFVA